MTRFVYVIIAHHDVSSLNVLLDNLGHRSTFVYLPYGAQIEARGIHSRPNIRVYEADTPAYWAGFSLVRAAIHAFKGAVDVFGEDSQLVLLSGQCTPIRPLSSFETWVKSTGYPILANSLPLSEAVADWSLSVDRLVRRYYFDEGFGWMMAHSGGLLQKIVKRLGLTFSHRVPNRLKRPVYAGSQWISIPGFVAIDLMKELQSGELDGFRGLFAPDELVIQSFVRQDRYSSMLKPFLVSSSAHTVALTANFHFLRPSMYGYLSLAELETAHEQGYFFARKVRLTRNSDVSLRVSELISG